VIYASTIRAWQKSCGRLWSHSLLRCGILRTGACVARDVTVRNVIRKMVRVMQRAVRRREELRSVRNAVNSLASKQLQRITVLWYIPKCIMQMRLPGGFCPMYRGSMRRENKNSHYAHYETVKWKGKFQPRLIRPHIFGFEQLFWRYPIQRTLKNAIMRFAKSVCLHGKQTAG